MEEVKIYVCEGHVDLALEAVAEDTLNPPIFDHVDKSLNSSTTCAYCNNGAVYVVSNVYSHTEC